VQKGSTSPTPPGYGTLWSTVALDLVGFGIVVPILALYAERFGASPFQIGLLMATYSLAQFVAAPLLGRLSDRVGRKPVIILSLVGTAVGSVVTGAAASLWMLYLGRLIDGASGGSVAVAQAAVTDMVPNGAPGQRERLLGMLGAAFGVGFVLGPAIGGLAALGGPHVPFYVAAALAGVNALAAAVRLTETRPGRSAPLVASRPSRTPSFAAPLAVRRWAIIGFLTMLAFVAFESTFSLFAARRFDLDESGVSVVFVCVGVVLMVMQGGLYGRLVARLGAASAFRAGVVVLAIGLVALAASESWLVLGLALTVLTVGQGCLSPSITSLVADSAPAEQRGSAMGVYQSANAMARVVGPLAATAAFQQLGLGVAFVAGAILCVVAGVVAAGWNRAVDARRLV
jgi:MFS family permease